MPVETDLSSHERESIESLPVPDDATASPGVQYDSPEIMSSDENSGGSKPTEEGEGEREANQEIHLPDKLFTIKINSPGCDMFDIQVTGAEMVHEIHQLLMDREDSCHRTCFSLQLEGSAGVVLDNYAELKTVEGLVDGSTLKVVEEPYTVREARIHVRHVRDLLKSVDMNDAYNGVDCQSPAFVNAITASNNSAAIHGRGQQSQSDIDCTPPDYIMPGGLSQDPAVPLPLLPLEPVGSDHKLLKCLKILQSSAWNPPPGNRKMHGDLMYLYVVTLEGSIYNITSSTRGFYVNLSTEEDFNPKPAEQKQLSHSLIELLNKISPLFKKNFANLLKKRARRHPLERVPTPFQVYCWIAPPLHHTPDAIRAEDAYNSKLGYEEYIPGQTRDWNEEICTTRQLPRKTLNERLLRERAIFKVHTDFVAAATRGAMAVIDGNIMAINPNEEHKCQMFIWNNIFFSLGFDIKDHYKEYGGDAAAHVAPNNDLQGVKAYSALDVEGLFTLGTVLIDYRGYRVTAQSIIPGILEREQEESVVYGSIDFGKSVVTSQEYTDLLSKPAEQLKILPHKIINDNGEEIEMFSSVDCKGIQGNDRRHYILDLLRTFPPDVNFLPVEGEELSEECQSLGFPRVHRHKLCVLRPELVEAFVEHRYILYVRNTVSLIMQQQSNKTTKEEKPENESADPAVDPKPDPAVDPQPDHSADNGVSNGATTTATEISEEEAAVAATTSNGDSHLSEMLDTVQSEMEVAALKGEVPTTEAVEQTAKALGFDKSEQELVRKSVLSTVGSLSSDNFDIRYNPDVFSPGIKHADQQSEEFQKQKQIVKDMAHHLLTHQIPTFIAECLEFTTTPINVQTLTDALHKKGINVRYLGKVADLAAKMPTLAYLHRTVVVSMVCRAIKHLFKTYMQSVGMVSLSSATCHFLNCVIGSYTNLHPHKSATFMSFNGHGSRKSKKSKKRHRLFETLCQDNMSWTTCTPAEMWQDIRAEVKEYFDFEISSESCDGFVSQHNMQKVTLLQEITQACGIQVLLKDYALDGKHKPVFVEADIVNIFPVVKHVDPVANDGLHFLQMGHTKVQQGFIKEGYEMISEALNLFNNVYGSMHKEMASCLRDLAKIHYVLGELTEAIDMQQKAVLMSERCLGITDPYTISEYVHLALYCFASGNVPTSLKLYYRARYLTLLIHGEDHPEMALIDSNIGLVLHGAEEYDLALKFLEKALETYSKYYGAKSIKVALMHHLIGSALSFKGDFRTAMKHEKQTYSLYREHFGEEHEKTRTSSDYLKHLTQQAVDFQKMLKEVVKAGSSKAAVAMKPVHIKRPSPASVVEMLNVVNGLVFITLSPQEVEAISKQVKNEGAATAALTAPQADGDSSVANATAAASINKPAEVAAESTGSEAINPLDVLD